MPIIRASAPFARADAATAITAIFNGKLEELLQRPSGQPFSLLPVETITEILGWLPVKDRVTASSTCKDWHTAAFSAPAIWTEVTYVSYLFRTPIALTKMLEYSAECPIFLEVGINDSDWATVCSEIISVMHRITRLDLDVGWNFDPVLQIELKRALSTPAPLLRMFFFDDPNSNLAGLGQEGLELFSDTAPRLRDVVFRCNINLVEPSYNAVFRSARRFKMYQPGETSKSDVAHAVKLFPKLKHLVVRIDTWRDDDTPSPPVELPRSLEVFEAVPEFYYLTPGHIIDSVRWRGVPRVKTRLSTDQATEDAVHNFFRATGQTTHYDARAKEGSSVASTLWIEWDVKAYTYTTLGVAIHTFGLATDDLYTLVPPSHPPILNSRLHQERILSSLSAPLPASLGEEITSLFLTELAFDPVSFPLTLPPFPCLESLTIWLVPAISHAEYYMSSPFVVSMFNQSRTSADWLSCLQTKPQPEETPRLVCPALKCLTIAAGHGEWPVDGVQPRLSPEQMCDFVRNCLDYNLERLRKLTFVGIELIMAHPESLSEMCALAESLECDPRFLLWTGNTGLHWNQMDSW